MIDSVIFIGTTIAAIVQLLKPLSEKITGPVTIVISALVGLVIALVDTHIGVKDISVAQGILTGLSTSGVVYGISKLGNPTSTAAPTLRRNR